MSARYILGALLAMAAVVYAAEPDGPPGLPSSSVVRPLLEADPRVSGARAGLEVGRHRLDADLSGARLEHARSQARLPGLVQHAQAGESGPYDQDIERPATGA